jgi:hypothetical protein
MSVRSLLRLLLTLLLPVALLSTVYVYLYPIAHRCAFPTPRSAASLQSTNSSDHERHLDPARSPFEYDARAPFRLLVLADPQLEGDSSLPDPDHAFLPRLHQHWQDVSQYNLSLADRRDALSSALKYVWFRDIPDSLQALRKRVDLLGNDYYLAHIYRTLHWWTQPSHVTVLGDLIGSQWVTDGEFQRRGQRYWNRVFAGGRRVEDDVTGGKGDTLETPFALEDDSWAHRIINIAGNHDIGYAGDVSEARVARFERIFGRANWDVRFQYPISGNATPEVLPTIHLIVLNSLNLDTPALSPDLQQASYNFINSVISSRSRPVEDQSSFTLLLTHLPLHKPAGVCVDAPYFDFFDFDDAEGRFKSGGVKEQNHLSDHGSWHGMLEGIFGFSHKPDAAGGGKGRNGLILTGHDHEGCDVWHHIPANATIADDKPEGADEKANWQAVPWARAEPETAHAGVREITLRSMMGEFGGNAGLLSVWFDFEAGRWKYEIQICKFGVQHIWWAVHILDIVTAVLGLYWAVMCMSLPKERGSKATHTTKSGKTGLDDDSNKPKLLGKSQNDI